MSMGFMCIYITEPQVSCMLADSYRTLVTRPFVMAQPLIIIADQTLSIQAQLGDLFAADADIVSVIQPEQLDYWFDSPSRNADILILQRNFFSDSGQFINRWREHPLTRGCDLIVMGDGQDEYEVEALLAGAVDYIRKPINPVLVLARVKAQLQRRADIARLEALSATDGLTGIANRRYLDQFLAAEWGRAQRDEGNLALIMIDIDHFKQYNDYYGHPAGDDVLIQVAQVLKNCAQRPRDLVARYGGEEFAVVLPSINLEGVEVVAQRLQQAIADLGLEHHGSVTSDYLTLSQGLAWCEPKAGEEWQLLIEAADEALYTAKASGRNQYSETVDLASVRMLIPN